MKVSIARIRLYLKEGKVLSDGTHPIMLMCSFNGRKEVSTGYSCTVKDWDKRNECCKKSMPNFIMINHHLKELKDEAIMKRDGYIASGIDYTPAMVLDKEDRRNVITGDLRGLINHYIDSKGLESKTVEKWWVVYRSIKKFVGRDILISEIDESFCRRYARWCEVEGLNDGSIRSYLGKIGAICHYAIEKGLMSVYPFVGWKYHKEYREGKSELYIHSRSIEVMMEMFLDEIIERDGELFGYRDGVIEELLDIHSSVYSHYLYCIGIYLKGIAPVDISLLKKKDIKFMMIKDIPCYAIDGSRSKTGMLYKIRVRQDCIESQVLIRTMLMFNDCEYFLPTLKDYQGKDIKKRVNNVYSYHSEHLVDWFRKVNEEIVRRNVENKDNIPLIDLDCRYYSYRHSYIMSEIQKPGVNLLALAQSVGKSSHSLHQYISLLGDIDLI